MLARLKGAAPLALVLGVLTFLFVDLALNFTFHWYTIQDKVLGEFGIPEDLHVIVPAAFVGWAMFFLLGSVRRVLVPAVTGSLGALLVIVLGSAFADSPDFWGVALAVGIAAAALVFLSTATDSDVLSPAYAFLPFAALLSWWFATGLDNYIPNGKGPRTAEALTSAITDTPLAAGTGAAGGLLSMSWAWVAISAFLSVVLGGVMGLATVKLTALLSRPRAQAVPADPAVPGGTAAAAG